jgi:Domain of unknown function (DUF4157)
MNAPSPLRPILPARAILPARPIMPAQPIRATRASRGSGVIQGAFLGGKPRLTMTAGRAGPATVQRSAAVPTANAIPTSNATPLPPEFGGFRPVMPAQRMPEAIQRKMETLFKTSFSDVRIHVGPDAGLIGASAFTQGSDLFFAPGQYNPNTPGGQRLLGQQLAHVVQQRTGRARNPFGSGIAVVNDPMLKAEAEMMGARASMPQALQAKAPGKGLVGSHAATASQRQIPGPILPKRAGAGATTAPTGRSPSAKAGPILPSVPGPILPKRIDAVGAPILPGLSTPFRATAGGPILPSKPVQAKLAQGPILPRRPSSIPGIASRAVQPMMAIGAAVAFGHQFVNSVVTQVGRRVLGL